MNAILACLSHRLSFAKYVGEPPHGRKFREMWCRCGAVAIPSSHWAPMESRRTPPDLPLLGIGDRAARNVRPRVRFKV